ncbi:MAG: RluA family pseudouridine synthase [Filifactor alocis]|nr:RluA family pseudouridine synthase [Filifactor alocis]
MSSLQKTYFVTSSDADRLDAYLAKRLVESSRSHIQKLIEEKCVFVNEKHEKKSFVLKEGDVVRIDFPEPKTLDVHPQELPLDILYEDDSVIVINKGKGIVVHPAAGNYEGTLVNALLFHCKGKLSEINGVLRPGIVHRIDKDTSGLLVVAKTNKAHLYLSEQFKEHSITREYEMICFGCVKEDRVTIDRPLGRNPKNRLQMAVVKEGKPAVTHFEILERFYDKTYMRATLETGRTHQIRVHSSYMGHPLLGDELYTKQKTNYRLQGQTLHAKKLGFVHPVTEDYIEFTSDLPDYFNKILQLERERYQSIKK